MLKRISLLAVAGILFGISLFSFVNVAPAYAQIDPKGQACQALDAASGLPGGCDPGATTKVDSTLKLGINMFSLIVGVAAVIMIIVGGLKYIISAGDSANINNAKNTILYAIIGLVVVALAQIIVRFVLDKTK